ncbi:MAG: hypothetical protein A2506_00960 [Elusimicrobia bacterium RIFOXYD12_FULL_66_9]|nr:MAG: hypothetical protein A2506_00960 [Elusimicrobia bacterium RIFOXYD12_FULL_66_9]
MAKNKKTMKKDVPAPPAPSEILSSRGKALLVAGGSSVLLGFLVLSRADPMGSNLASSVSPFLILGGYAAIAVGLFLPASS